MCPCSRKHPGLSPSGPSLLGPLWTQLLPCPRSCCSGEGRSESRRWLTAVCFFPQPSHPVEVREQGPEADERLPGGESGSLGAGPAP